MEDYSNIIIALATSISTIIAICKILGKKFNRIEDDLKEIKKDIQNLDRRIQRIEDRLEYSNKIVYVQHEETKEN